MAKKLELRLMNTETKKTEVYTRDEELSVRNKLDLAEMQDTFREEAEKGKMTNVRAIRLRTGFLANLFDISEDTIIDGMIAESFDDDVSEILKRISPEDFPEDEELDESEGK